jgi:hypothetical protein
VTTQIDRGGASRNIVTRLIPARILIAGHLGWSGHPRNASIRFRQIFGVYVFHHIAGSVLSIARSPVIGHQLADDRDRSPGTCRHIGHDAQKRGRPASRLSGHLVLDLHESSGSVIDLVRNQGAGILQSIDIVDIGADAVPGSGGGGAGPTVADRLVDAIAEGVREFLCVGSNTSPRRGTGRQIRGGR